MFERRDFDLGINLGLWYRCSIRCHQVRGSTFLVIWDSLLRVSRPGLAGLWIAQMQDESLDTVWLGVNESRAFELSACGNERVARAARELFEFCCRASQHSGSITFRL